MHTGKQKQMNAIYQASLVNHHIRRFTGQYSSIWWEFCEAYVAAENVHWVKNYTIAAIFLNYNHFTFPKVQIYLSYI